MMEFYYEPCTECGGMNGFAVHENEWSARCNGCGSVVMLCTKCLHAEDNLLSQCDFDKGYCRRMEGGMFS